MLKKMAIVIVAALAALLLFAATRPDSFRIERKATIQAPPEKVFGLINDFHQWPLWSPWEKLDPAMKRTLGGPMAGLGATYAWEGNSDVGAGRMEIKESVPSSKVHIQLDFLQPFESHNQTDFILTPQGNGTEVNWAMYGKADFMTKLMSVFSSMDSMVGPDFEKGLANMKAVAEKN
ncbi:MAG TPA: SRPBCC family protein [Ideonella sp.]|uniref:SRPBCC family protein n=1 Tax=Ideonella sp. TaxID=1929293 RepID=UPI002E307CCB|nr:SRPBCC family protein [Ideonella sp.]HEX5683728.1 SRPBCC family protein [Ideonella sp.]